MFLKNVTLRLCHDLGNFLGIPRTFDKEQLSETKLQIFLPSQLCVRPFLVIEPKYVGKVCVWTGVARSLWKKVSKRFVGTHYSILNWRDKLQTPLSYLEPLQHTETVTQSPGIIIVLLVLRIKVVERIMFTMSPLPPYYVFLYRDSD